MESNGGLLRVASLTLVAVAIWFLGTTFQGLPTPRGLDAAATDFSAARAYATLGRILGEQVPHPVSSAANQAVRDRVRAEFDRLGVSTLVDRRSGCNGRANVGFFACGTVEDIIADVAPGRGKAIVLVAHYDSVPAGPGASDDQSGVVTILETIRALKARGMKTQHPIIAVITDGEEAGLLGAAAFVDNPQFKDRIGVVVNVEARGNQGPSLLFQTSPGDGRLIDLYAKSVPEYAASSLFAVIYKLLPNDTDLTIFLNRQLTGYNFAFSGNVAHYHTPLDRRENLSQATLQMHGDNALGIVSGLMQTGFDSLQGGDAVYLTLLGHLLPRMPAGWALPLAILALLVLAATAWFSKGEVLGIGRRLAAISIPPVVLVGAAAFGWLLHVIASLVSGQPDPGYAYPLVLRIALALGVLAATLLAARISTPRLTALSVWLWIAVLGLIAAFFLPGLSPYFVFPAIVAAILLAVQSRLTHAWTGMWAELAIFVAALLPLLIWLSLSGAAESIQGLALHPLITITLAFGAMTLLPLITAHPLSRGAWRWAIIGVSAAAVIAAVAAGLQPAYSAMAPQRLNIVFVDDHVANKGEWAMDTGAPVPAEFRAVQPFSDQAAQVSPLAFQKMYVAPAGATRFDPPSADAVIGPQGKGRVIVLTVHASDRANRVVVVVPKSAGLTKIDFRGKTFTPRPDSLLPGTLIACVTDDCRSMRLKLTFATAARVDLTLGEQTYGLPEDGGKLARARPATTIPSQNGDNTIVFGKLTL